MNKIILVVALLLHEALSSLVIDRYSQDGIHVSDYCPDMPYCTEGSHVMCMYYNPNRTMGPRCENPQNVTMNTLLANKLLDFTNAIRGKIALGKEKGQNGTPLPKAYGMMRVEWDSELATIAQVFANQCLMSHDLCRATKRFQDPGQVMGLCRFLFPTWQELTHSEHREHTTTGLTINKLLHAMNQVVKSWYTRKNSVHTDMILNYPDWTQTPTIPKLYMELIYAPITHMGCGLSAYTAYDYHSRSDVNFNVVQVVCNFSARPHRGQQVYNIEPPSEVGYTIKCGCPPGFDEDNDCLCYETQRKAVTAHPDLKREGSCTDDGNCKPSVVLLPIFTVENAPPEKLMTRKESHYRTRFESNIPELDILDTPIQAMNTSAPAQQRIQKISRPPNIQSVLNKIIQETHPSKYIITTTTTRTWGRVVRNRFFDKKTTPRSSFHPKIGHALGYGSTKKESIFSKVPTFDLKRKTYNSYKQDVKPRRDFSDVKNLVRNYMSNRKGRIDNADILVMSPVTAKRSKTQTETVLSSAEEKVMKNNYYITKINFNSSVSKGKFDEFSDLDSIKATNEKNDDTLMHLLDKLEQEVRNTELDGSRKEMFDAKIRKIYDTVVGKPVDLLPRTHLDKYETDLTDYETADFERYENDRGRYPDFDNRERSAKTLHHKLNEFAGQGHRIDPIDKYFDLEQKGRPMSRNRNSLVLDDKLEKEHNIRSLTKNNYDLELEQRYDYDRQKGLHKSIYGEDDEFKSRHTYNEKAEKLRGLLSELEAKREFDDIVDKRRIMDNEHNDDPLGLDRRKYYQAKLENLERKLQSTRSRYKNLKDNNVRQLRVVRPTARDEEPLRPAKVPGDPFYMPDRARFLHGF